MAFDLAKNRINILDIHSLENEKEHSYALLFEFQYENKDKSKIWQKDVAVFNLDHPFEPSNDMDTVSENIIKYVKEARPELEK